MKRVRKGEKRCEKGRKGAKRCERVQVNECEGVKV